MNRRESRHQCVGVLGVGMTARDPLRTFKQLPHTRRIPRPRRDSSACSSCPYRAAGTIVMEDTWVHDRRGAAVDHCAGQGVCPVVAKRAASYGRRDTGVVHAACPLEDQRAAARLAALDNEAIRRGVVGAHDHGVRGRARTTSVGSVHNGDVRLVSRIGSLGLAASESAIQRHVGLHQKRSRGAGRANFIVL